LFAYLLTLHFGPVLGPKVSSNFN